MIGGVDTFWKKSQRVAQPCGGHIVNKIVKEPGGHIQKVSPCCLGGYFLKEISMYPLDNAWTNCLKNHNEITMYLLDKCLLSPSVKCSQFSGFLDISLQCPQNFPKIFWKWYTMGEIVSTFWMCHSGTLPAHRSGSFWVLLAGNTVITLLGKSEGTLWMTHSKTSWGHSLGTFGIFLIIP